MNLYVHVPFCAVKCGYCAFKSGTGFSTDAMRRYIDLVGREVSLRALRDVRPDTIYVGGGTPSLLGPAGIAALFAALPRPADGAEVSVECNPGDVSPELAAALRKAGCTRASLGVQSFSDRALKYLGRRHDASAARAAFAMLRRFGPPLVSADLIAALPGAPEGELVESLRELAGLRPDHASVYPLSIEPGTPFARAGIAAAGEEIALKAVAAAERTLAEAGLVRYEISNYAVPGCECRHNLAVWRGEDYSGVGPAACSREGLARRENESTFERWAAAIEGGKTAFKEDIAVSPGDDEAERFVVRTRLVEFDGPPPGGEASAQRRLAALRRLSSQGLVKNAGSGRWRLTARGREVADAVMAELL